MATLATLRTRVQDLGYGSDTATQQTNAINGALREVYTKRPWQWREATATATATIGTEILSTGIPTDLGSPLSVRLLDSTFAGYDLTYLVPDAFRKETLLTTPVQRARPVYWTRFAGSWRLNPLPDKAYSVVIDYLKTFTALSADGDEAPTPDEWEDVIVFRACQRLALRERDTDSAAWFGQQFEDLLDEMVREDGIRQRQEPGQVEQVDRFRAFNEQG